jgi:hypothetical protein
MGKQGEHGELDGAFIVGKVGDTRNLVGAEDEGGKASPRPDGVRLSSPTSDAGVGGHDEDNGCRRIPLLSGNVIGEPAVRLVTVDGELYFDDDDEPELGLRATE